MAAPNHAAPSLRYVNPTCDPFPATLRFLPRNGLHTHLLHRTLLTPSQPCIPREPRASFAPLASHFPALPRSLPSFLCSACAIYSRVLPALPIRLLCSLMSTTPSTSGPLPPQQLEHPTWGGHGILGLAPQTLAAFMPTQVHHPLCTPQQVGPSPSEASLDAHTWVLDTGATLHMSSSDGILLTCLLPLLPI